MEIHPGWTWERPWQFYAPSRAGFQRFYFDNGQLNAEAVKVAEAIRYTASFDRDGRDLASNGNGELRLHVRVSDGGELWRIRALKGGYLDGDVREVGPDGSVASKQL